MQKFTILKIMKKSYISGTIERARKKKRKIESERESKDFLYSYDYKLH